MRWNVQFHPAVYDDLKRLGNTEAKRVLKAIDERIANGEPDKIGKPLNGTLAGFRRLRVGDVRIVYRINGTEIVLVVCVGPRRNDEVYETVTKRL